MIVTLDSPKITEGGKTSRWNAGRAPVSWLLQRRDFEVVNTALLPGKLRVNIYAGFHSEPEIISQLAVGETIYLSSAGMEGIFTILTGPVDIFGNQSQYRIEVSGDLNGTTGLGGYLNAISGRPDYFVAILADTAAGKTVENRYRPGNSGHFHYTADQVLYHLLEPEQAFGYDVVNAVDAHGSLPYTLLVKEYWTSGSFGTYLLNNQPFYLTHASAQVGEAYGSNLYQYVPDKDSGLLARFLTGFQQPVYFEGWPFSLSFIYPELLEAIELVKTEEQQGPDGSVMQSSDKVLPDHTAGAVHQMTLDGNNGAYPAGIHQLGVALALNKGLNKGYMQPTFVSSAYVKGGAAKPQVTAGQAITEQLTVLLSRQCYENPVYLCWMNALGGWDYWLFHTAQRYSVNTANSSRFQPAIYKLEQAVGRQYQGGKRGYEVVQLGAEGLTDDQVAGIKGLFLSPRVYELQPDGRRRVVTLADGERTYRDSANNRHSMEFSIVLPELFI